VSDSVVTELRASSAEVETRAGAVAAVVAFEGDLDLAAIGVFDEAIAAAAGDAGIVVDLSRVRFIDSSGIHALVRTRAATAERGAGFELVVAAGSAVERVLDMSGLRDALGPRPDRESALVALDERTRAPTAG